MELIPRAEDETLYEQFKAAMSRLEAIAVDDWPGVDASEPALTEVRAQDMPSGSMAL